MADPREWLAEVQETVDTERVLRDGDPFYEVQGYLPDGTPLMECNRWERVGLDASAAMADALLAVLELHEPIHALDYGAPVRGGRLTHVCTGCGQDDGNWQYWPCPTVRAVTEHLEATP